jgi:polyphosphate kinase 2 (PPK2 family)
MDFCERFRVEPGTRVHCFEEPTPEEAAHDFLWRVHRQVPARGEIAIFDRSHYEDVLVVRVRELVAPPEALLSALQSLPHTSEFTVLAPSVRKPR